MTDRFEKFVILIFFLFLVSAIGIGLYAVLAQAQELPFSEGTEGLTPDGSIDFVSSTSPIISVQKTDAQLLDETKVDLEEKNLTLSKYAKLYDGCRNTQLVTVPISFLSGYGNK